MATKTTPDAPGGYHSPFGQEVAPSELRAEEPGRARVVGLVGLCAIFVGLAVISMNYYAQAHDLPPRLISTPWGYVVGFLGVVMLLFHAARDADPQIRRTY